LFDDARDFASVLAAQHLYLTALQFDGELRPAASRDLAQPGGQRDGLISRTSSHNDDELGSVRRHFDREWV
jgi:hypothetical protein